MAPYISSAIDTTSMTFRVKGLNDWGNHTKSEYYLYSSYGSLLEKGTVTTFYGHNPNSTASNKYDDGYTFYNLSSNTTYKVTIMVYYLSSGEKSSTLWSLESKTTNKISYTPTFSSLTCTSLSGDNATFQISAGSNTTHYRWKLMDSTGTNIIKNYVSTTTNTYKFTGLTPGTSYQCWAYPRHVVHDSDYSDQDPKKVSFTTLSVPQITGATITQYPNSLYVTLTQTGAAGFYVTVKNSSGTTLTNWDKAYKSSNYFEIGQLPCNSTFSIDITPYNSYASGTTKSYSKKTLDLFTALTATPGAKSLMGTATMHSSALLQSSGAFKWELRNSSNTTTLKDRTTDSTKNYQNFGNDCCSENTAYYIRCTAYDKYGGSSIWDTKSATTTKSWFNNLTAYGYPTSLTAVASINATSCWTKCEVYKGASVSGSPVKSVAWVQKTSSTPERTIDGLDYNTVYTCRFYCVDNTANASYASSWDRSFICRPPIFSWTSAETKIFTSRGKISDITVQRWNEFVENVALCCEWYWWTDVKKKPDGVDIRAGKIDENSDYKVLTAEKFNCPRGGIGGMKKLVIENDPDNSVPEQEKGNQVLGRYFTKMVSTLASVDHRSWDINSKLTGGK
jgi:hypothetical protein